MIVIGFLPLAANPKNRENQTVIFIVSFRDILADFSPHPILFSCPFNFHYLIRLDFCHATSV
jgi:hypothetical protein